MVATKGTIAAEAVCYGVVAVTQIEHSCERVWLRLAFKIQLDDSTCSVIVYSFETKASAMAVSLSIK